MNPYAAPPPPRIDGGPNDGGWNQNRQTNGNRWETNHASTNVNMHQQQPQWQRNNHHHSNQRQNNQNTNQYNQQSQSHQQLPNRQTNNVTMNQNNSNSSNYSNPQNISASKTTQYAVLYTHQKTKKKPTWKDGRLTLTSTRASLYDANPPPGSSDAPLDTLEMTRNQIINVTNGQCQDLESEKYKIQIEGVWRSSFTLLGGDAAAVRNARPSVGMKKVMSNKFRVPKRVVPNFEERRRLKMEKENKRRRVLQPGELERMYGGGSGGENWGHGDSFRGGNGYNCDNLNDGYQSNQQNGQCFQKNQYNDEQHASHQNCVNDGYSQSNQSGQYNNVNQRFNQNNVISEASQSNSNQHFNQNDTNDQYNDSSNQCFNQNGTSARPNISNDPSFATQRSFNQNNSGPNNNNFNYNARGPNQRGTNPNSQYNRGPMAFKSNGVDGSGYYQEEEDDEDACNDFNGDNSNTNQQQVGDDFARGPQTINQNNHGNTSQSKSNERHTTDGDSSSNEHSANVNSQQCVNQSEMSTDRDQSQNGNDQRVTDELLALLGATNEPAYDNRISHVCNDASNKQGQSNPTINTSNPTQGTTDNDGPNRNTSSLLAGLEDAEDNLDDHDYQQPMPFDFNEQQFDSQDDNFDDESFNLDDDLPNDDNNDTSTKTIEDAASRDVSKGMSEQQITPLTLPSAGESSSDDEDSLAE